LAGDDVTLSQWADWQIELSRKFIRGEVSGHEFGPDFLDAQSKGADSWEIAEEAKEEVINDILFALSNHTPFDDERLPDQLDDEQLRAAISKHLADYDAGKYDPSNW
jgi:hypothetical protein